MQILVYSETDASNIGQKMGKPEYSYYFILKAYLPVLESLGTVVHIRDPETEVDQLYREGLNRDENTVFLSFTPPHRITRGLSCPTVCVLAWEFSSIPDQDLGQGDSDNWVATIKEIGNVLTISDYSTEVIRRQVGGALHLQTIPAPVTREQADPDAVFNAAQWPAPDLTRDRALQVSAHVIDTRALDISDHIAIPVDSDSPAIEASGLSDWSGESLEYIFDAVNEQDNGYHLLVGFDIAEEWGAWARSDRPWINLPASVSGDFELTLKLIAFGDNVGRSIDITVGGQTHNIVIDGDLREHVLSFTGVGRGTCVAFSGLVIDHTAGSERLRALSLGIGGLRLRSLNGQETTIVAGSTQSSPGSMPVHEPVLLEFPGIIYTAIFNPEDGRKNWEDILKAFCWAFREQSDKTLILKLSCPDMAATLGKLIKLFSQLNPFACRVVVLHGYLMGEELQRLMQITDYVVNASHAEGQCLPLLEFMARGVPAIAPDHTAMASYINPANALVVDSWRQATCWPQDLRRAKRTFFYEIDWESLMHCFLRSARIVEDGGDTYSKMSFNAAQEVRSQYSLTECDRRLRDYLQPWSKAAQEQGDVAKPATQASSAALTGGTSVTIDFLVPGFSKCGTTTLCAMLERHPDIYIPAVKEPWYFSSENFAEQHDHYDAHFAAALDHQLKGEGSVSYSGAEYEDISIERICANNPLCKFIFIARNPKDRLESSYREMHNSGVQYGFNAPYSLNECLLAFPQMVKDNLYWQRIDKYRQCFGDAAILVLFLEDLRTDPLRELHRCFAHLGLALDKLPDFHEERLNDGQAKLFDTRLLRYLRNHPWAGPQLARIGPLEQDKFLRPLQLRRPFGRRGVPWDENAQRTLAEVIYPDARRFLQFYNKDPSFWGLDKLD